MDGLGGVKKKLNIIEDKVVVEENNEQAMDVVRIEGEEKEVENVIKKVDPPVVGCLEWQLAIGSPSNVVAYATIETDDEGREQTLYGVPLEKENAQVLITCVIHGAAIIHFPIKDEI